MASDLCRQRYTIRSTSSVTHRWHIDRETNKQTDKHTQTVQQIKSCTGIASQLCRAHVSVSVNRIKTYKYI